MISKFYSQKKLDNVIRSNFDKDIFSNTTQYYFTDLDGKYEYANKLMAQFLSDIFGKKFKPIYLLSCEPNKFYKKDNYVILNHNLKQSKLKRHIELLDSEELNEEFSKSIFIKKLIDKLSKKQDTIFIYNFTSSFLVIDHPKIKIIGPNPKIATKYDSKYNQHKLFKKLELPTIENRLCRNINEAKTEIKNNYNKHYISVNYGSGGFESRAINNIEELLKFHADLRSINKNGPFIVSKFIDDIIISPNVNAIIINNKEVQILNITDQLLKGNKYIGNIYPSKINSDLKIKIEKSVIKLGKQLAKEGFRGIFGCDFIIDNNCNLYIVDLNPRRQGSYPTLCLINKNLVKTEIGIAINKKIFNHKLLNFDCDFSWAHSKIVYWGKNKKRICGEFKINSETLPFSKIGSEFISSFYPKNFTISEGNLGYHLISGKKYTRLLKKIITDQKNILDKILNIRK